LIGTTRTFEDARNAAERQIRRAMPAVEFRAATDPRAAFAANADS